MNHVWTCLASSQFWETSHWRGRKLGLKQRGAREHSGLWWQEMFFSLSARWRIESSPPPIPVQWGRRNTAQGPGPWCHVSFPVVFHSVLLRQGLKDSAHRTSHTYYASILSWLGFADALPSVRHLSISFFRAADEIHQSFKTYPFPKKKSCPGSGRSNHQNPSLPGPGSHRALQELCPPSLCILKYNINESF